MVEGSRIENEGSVTVVPRAVQRYMLELCHRGVVSPRRAVHGTCIGSCSHNAVSYEVLHSILQSHPVDLLKLIVVMCDSKIFLLHCARKGTWKSGRQNPYQKSFLTLLEHSQKLFPETLLSSVSEMNTVLHTRMSSGVYGDSAADHGAWAAGSDRNPAKAFASLTGKGVVVAHGHWSAGEGDMCAKDLNH